LHITFKWRVKIDRKISVFQTIPVKPGVQRHVPCPGRYTIHRPSLRHVTRAQPSTSFSHSIPSWTQCIIANVTFIFY